MERHAGNCEFSNIVNVKSHALIMPRLTKFIIITYNSLCLFVFVCNIIILLKIIFFPLLFYANNIDVMISGLYSRLHFQSLPLNYLFRNRATRAHTLNSISLSVFLVCCLPQS